MENGNSSVRGDPWQLDLARRLRAGERVPDAQFDQLFAPETRAVSFRHWTPVRVASRAAGLLTEAGASEILDVGSGPGKFCLVGALRTGARFTGVEQRRRLVEEAHIAAVELGADRAQFIHANLLEFDCSPFDGFYFYNPFHEHIEEDDLWPIDELVKRSPVLHRTYVATVAAALIRAPAGTLVATFHGFGAPMPRHYRRLHREQLGGGELTLWIRMGSPQPRASGPEPSRPGELPSASHEPEVVRTAAPIADQSDLSLVPPELTTAESDDGRIG
ncbi:MAG TPA: class I SAM-dependent methyltransferase [Polyangia bacterium]|nr:class I SAM-dependent methyltransferase [Polyangia bacterium]